MAFKFDFAADGEIFLLSLVSIASHSIISDNCSFLMDWGELPIYPDFSFSPVLPIVLQVVRKFLLLEDDVVQSV